MAFSFITLSSNAQVDPATGNLINYGTTPTDTTSVWNNGVYVNQLCFGAGQPGNCGPNPSVRPGGYINFSYGTADLNQVVNINRALESAGTGVQLSGFNYSFTAKNGNGWDDARQDYLAAYVKLYGAGGNQIANYDYSAATNRKYNWTNFSFNETFATPYTASSLSTAQVGFVGRDNNFWAGNYGPEIFNVSFSLKYKVDPCALNPAYSSTCTGFNSIINTDNLLDSTRSGTSLTQAFAINTALSNAGVGAKVHGFNYGFNYTVGESWSGCTATNQDGSCSWYMDIPGRVNATVSLTNKNNQTIFSKNYSFTGDGNIGSVSDKYLLSSSLNQTALGSGRISGNTSGTGGQIDGMWATLIYTADPCVTNPLYSPDCKGYALALAKQLAPSSTSTSTISTPPPLAVEVATIEPSSTSPSPPSPGNVTNNTVIASQTPTSSSVSQPKAGEVKAAGDTKPGPSLSTVLSMINSNQDRIGNEAKTVVQSAEAAAAKDAQQAQEQAESVAATLTTQSIAGSSAQSLTGSGSATRQNSTSVVTLQTSEQSSAAGTSGLRPHSTPIADVATLQTNSQSSGTSPAGLRPYTAVTAEASTATSVANSSESIKTGPTSVAQETETLPQPSMVSVLQKPQLPQLTAMPLPAPQTPLLPPPPPQTSALTTQTATQQILPPAPLPQTQVPTTTTQVAVQQILPSPTPQAPVYQAPEAVQLQLPTVNYSLSQPTFSEPYKRTETASVTDIEEPKSEGLKIGTRSVLNDYINEKPFMSLIGMEQTQDGNIRRNAQPNEVAGSVDIANIATQPKGYDVYSLMTLKDISFYKVEEIYKNRQTVDNVRVLRSLQSGSDRLHQEMVNQQYK